MIDVADEKVFRAYLQKHQLISDLNNFSLRRLGGGVSCEVILVTSPERSFVVKQALPKLRVKEDWFSDVARITTEKDCLAFYNKVVPEYTPRLLFYDEENSLYGMEAVSENFKMWKTVLIEGTLNFSVAREVASALARVHNASADDTAVKARFASQKFFIELRIEPYLRTVAERHPALEDITGRQIAQLLERRAVLVHGDYSPKNILVADSNKIFILDFEVAHIGDASFDLGFLTNHFLLKAIKNKQWALGYLNMAAYIAATYLKEIKFTNPKMLEADTIKTLALLFLARVDGKSPVEYINDAHDKELIRRMSYGILRNDIRTYRDLAGYSLEQIGALA